MKYKIGELIYFSPTKTTKRILESIAEGFGSTSHQHRDATYSNVSNDDTFCEDEICVIGSPVYAGRLPSTFLSRISHIKGHGRWAVVVVVYGNRDFEDALVELYDFVLAHGFKPIAVGAFIGEHSYSTVQFPLSQGRPDFSDLTKAMNFGKSLLSKVTSESKEMVIMEASIPGNRPYKPIIQIMNVAPFTDLQSCTMCHSCVFVCPVHAITTSNPSASDDHECIRCCACIKACPVSARSMTDERIGQIINRLYTTCIIRKEPIVIA